MTPHDHDAIEPAVLEDLASKVGGRGPGFQNVVQAYVDASITLVDDLVRAARNGDVREAARHAHTLKSSSAWVGATALAAMCRAIEADPDSATVDRAQELQAEHRRVLASLGDVLNEAAADA